MALKQAATLSDTQLESLLERLTETTRRPIVERAVFLLSYKAGLRAQEIAGLEWGRHLLDVDGNIRRQAFTVPGANGRPKEDMHPVLWISSDIGKYGADRTLRIHPLLLTALTNLQEQGMEGKYVIPSGYKNVSPDLKSRAHALAVRINRHYAAMGFAQEGAEKCSSHSGRRTFITKAARVANFAGCSIRDVQDMAGHKQLVTTQAYIDTTSQQADLIGML